MFIGSLYCGSLAKTWIVLGLPGLKSYDFLGLYR